MHVRMHVQTGWKKEAIICRRESHCMDFSQCFYFCFCPPPPNVCFITLPLEQARHSVAEETVCICVVTPEKRLWLFFVFFFVKDSWQKPTSDPPPPPRLPLSPPPSPFYPQTTGRQLGWGGGACVLELDVKP